MHRYLVALGSNIRHARYGSPARVLEAALAALSDRGIDIECRSPILSSAPLGPSRRQYANAALVGRTPLEPPQFLALLKELEAEFGRRPGGRRWSARVLDLDIVLWSGGKWTSKNLKIPHPAFRMRDFVLRPALAVAADWRDPISGLSLRHLHARLTRPHSAPR